MQLDPVQSDDYGRKTEDVNILRRFVFLDNS